MNTTPRNQPHVPPLRIDIEEILAAIALELSRIQACGQCHSSVPSLINDLAQLVSEITRLHAELIRQRLISANLHAAIRAALGAHADGEPDPLAYLRDELPDTTETPGPHVSGERGRS